MAEESRFVPPAAYGAPLSNPGAVRMGYLAGAVLPVLEESAGPHLRLIFYPLFNIEVGGVVPAGDNVNVLEG